MDQLKNILVAVDFSDSSKAALAQAVRLADGNDARLHALHVIEPLVVSDLAWAMHACRRDADRMMIRQAQAKLTAWIEEAGGQGEAIVVVGSPLHEVLTQVRAVSGDLLVTGMRGSTPPTQGPGTLAAKLARSAPTQLLLVSEAGIMPFRRVVVCVDFSFGSGLAIEAARRVAEAQTSEIHCLHVFNPPSQRLFCRACTPEAWTDLQRECVEALQGRLEEFAEQHEGFNMRCELFPWSSHRQGIAQYAREIKADLVILGGRGHRTLRSFVMGSAAEQLLRELPCSVLTVRLPDAEASILKPESTPFYERRLSARLCKHETSPGLVARSGDLGSASTASR